MPSQNPYPEENTSVTSGLFLWLQQISNSSLSLQKKVFKVIMQNIYLNKIETALDLKSFLYRHQVRSHLTRHLADCSSAVTHRARFWGWESLCNGSSVAFICNAKSVRIVFLIWYCRLHSSFDPHKKNFLLDLSTEPVLNFPSRAHWWKQDVIVSSAFCTNPDLHIS